MQLRSVFVKSAHDQWRPVLIWSIFAALLPGLYVALYPSIGAARTMQDFFNQLPEAYRALFASSGGFDLSTAEGYLNIELFSFVGPLLLLAVGVALGAGATASEEEQGTADLLLANPIRRRRIVAEKAAAMLLWTAVVAVAIWVGVAMAAAAAGVSLRLDRVAAALGSCALLGAAFGGVAMAVGALLGRRMPAFALALGLAVVAYFVNALAPLVAGMKDLRLLSPFYWYVGNDPLTHGIEPVHAAALIATAAIGIAIAAIAWERRDIHG